MTSHRHILSSALIILACFAVLSAKSGKQAAPAKQKLLPALSAQEIFKRVSPSVMVVESLDADGKATKFGSGVVIGPLKPWEKKWTVPPVPGKVYKVLGSLVVTNRHVIEDGVSYRVEHNGKKWSAKLTKVDPHHDLAELSVAGLDAPAVTVLDSAKLAVGETVYAIGAPEGLELTISEGLISGLRDFDKGRVIQTSAAISPGSSGGGLFDAQGRLVGITTFYLKEGQSLNFALPAEWALALNHQPPIAAPTSQNAKRGAVIWFMLGCKALEVRAFSLAEVAFNEAIRLKPDDADSWVNLGFAYEHLGKYDQSEAAERQAIRLAPDEEEGWMNLGVAYTRLGEWAKAVSAEQQAVRLKPDDDFAWRNLGAAYLGIGQTAQAVNAAQTAVRLNPRNAELWYGLGLCFKFDGQRLQVVKVYEKLKGLDPNLAEKFFEEAVVP